MDHKVSKDMISSGMIPSGEKTQADLGRIQYGSAPSPSSLMDAYKSMYEKKEEVINEMASFKKLRGRQKRIQRTPRGGSSGSGVYDATTGGKHDSQTPGATGSVSGPGQGKPMIGKVTTRKVDPRTLKNNPRADIQTNSFDLLAAYHAVYEHHKKDADGNTIPHEGEEINEALPLLAAPLIAKGLMAAKGAMAAAKAAKLGAVAAKGIGAFKKGLMTSKAVGAAGKITTSGGKLAAGAQKVGMAQKAGQATRSGLAAMKNNPMATYIGVDAIGSTASAIKGGKSPAPQSVQQTKLGRRTAGMYNDVDLFDIVKGQLLDEGLTENEVLDVMTTLTIDEINEVINVEESLAKLALKTGAVVAGGVLAKKGLDKAKQSVDNQINKARDKGIGGNTRPGADKMYFGK
jgi:hypothetical protein